MRIVESTQPHPSLLQAKWLQTSSHGVGNGVATIIIYLLLLTYVFYLIYLSTYLNLILLFIYIYCIESIVEAQVETHTSDSHLHAEKWTTMDTSATPEYKFLPLRMFHIFRTVYSPVIP